MVKESRGACNAVFSLTDAEAIDLPLSSDAVQFYKSGRPFLQNYLPFWMASLFTRLLIVLVPVLGVLYPLMRFLPALYAWMMRSKISRGESMLTKFRSTPSTGTAPV